jgi:hypothetical protein
MNAPRQGRDDRLVDPYGEPFFWWGPRWEPPRPHRLGALLEDGTIDLWSAAHLWAALARRRSLAVVAGPSGVGKTTLLTALLDLLPAETRRVYIRGCYEDFAFLDDPRVDPRRTSLLVNELSPHLPVYLWGAGVARLLAAAPRGYQLLTTAHAASGLEFAASLAGSPLRLTAPAIAAFDIIVALAFDMHRTSGRGVTGVWRLRATERGITAELLPTPPASEEDAWFVPAEIAERMQFLAELRAGERAMLPEVRVTPDASRGSAHDAWP